MNPESYSETKVKLLLIYYFSFGVYAIPPICIVLFFLNVCETSIYFWLTFLLGTLPCAFVGTILFFIGWKISIKRNIRKNITVGMLGTIFGIMGIIIGVALWGLFYLVVGS